MTFKRVYLGLALFCIVAAAACNQPKLSSQWRGHEVVIDGADDEWEGARVYIENTDITVGVLNDNKDLYLTLSVIDRSFQTQIARRGFTIWFDQKGGKRKNFGVRFPLGMQELLAQELVADMNEPGQYGPGGGGGFRSGYGGPNGLDLQREMEPDRLEDLFDRLMEGAEMELLGLNPKDRQRVPLATSEAILMQVKYVNGRLIYELRVPLARVTRPDKQGKPIGVGFEVPELNLRALWRAQEANRTAEGELSGGRAGALGGGGERGGYGADSRYGRGPRGANAVISQEAFELWTKVDLARKPGS